MLIHYSTASRELTDAVSSGFNDGSRWAGTTWSCLAEVEPVADNSVLEIIILVAEVHSDDVQ